MLFLGDDTFTYYSNTMFYLVQCPPPYNITVALYTETKVFISWLRNSCNNTEIWLYIYFKDTSINSSIWEWVGVPPDDQSTILSNLVPSHQYKAYMLTAVPDGNGLPSIVFSLQSSGNGMYYWCACSM